MSAVSLSDSLLDLNCSASTSTADDGSGSAGDDEAAGGVGGAGDEGAVGGDGAAGGSGSISNSYSAQSMHSRSAEGDGAVAGPSRHHHHHQQQQQQQQHHHHNSQYRPQPQQQHEQQQQQQVCNYVAADETYREFCEEFQFENLHSCWICNGYYAPNFGEPVCGVCHAFVFAVPTHEGIKVHQVTMVSDDEDSGNDEPPYNAADKDRAAEDGAEGVDEDVDEDDDEDDDDEDDDDEAAPAEPEMELEEAVADGSDNEHDVQDDDEGDADDLAPINAVAHRPRPIAQPPLNLNQYIDLLSQPYIGARTDNNIDALPVEVLLVIFQQLDDVSLWHVSRVCRRWRTILETYIPATVWAQFVRDRWPLFEAAQQSSCPPPPTPQPVPRNWFAVYSALMGSSFCRSCLVQMGLKTPLPGRIANFRLERLRCDFRALELDDIDGIAALPLDKTLSHWQATIAGPAGSPYAGGKFFLYIVFPCQYPMQPPALRFLTKIIHPNVSRHGDVGCDIIQHNWSLALTISKLLLSVQSLLTDPFTEICMEPQVGRLYAEDRPKFNALARSWTRKFAMLDTQHN